MYIDKVRLTNIRGFRDLDFSFDRGNGTHAGWTVLTGDNGSGKSTVLKCIALLTVSARTRFLLEPKFNSYIKKSQATGTVDLYPINTIQGCAKKIQLIAYANNDISISRDPPYTNEDINSNAVPFACGYGPFRRISGHSEDASRLMELPQTSCFATMFSESASLAEADSWLRILKYKNLEGNRQATETLHVVLELINDEFLPNQINVDRVDSDGLWLKDREDNKLSWSDMSDGYRAALALLTDILRHMVNTYGTDNLTGRDADGCLFLKPSGVVLIDEIDAHLHPEWQREIGFWLKKRFPNIQFIVTSHSPLICQAADPNGLFVLPEPGSDEPARALTPEEYQEVITSKSDTILRSPAFGLRNTRSDMVVEKRARYSRLQSRLRQLGSLPEPDQQELVELSRYINPDEEP